jgi:hypothetical protein
MWMEQTQPVNILYREVYRTFCTGRCTVGDKLFLDTKRYYVAYGVQYREKVTLNSSSYVNILNILSCTVNSVP